MKRVFSALAVLLFVLLLVTGCRKAPEEAEHFASETSAETEDSCVRVSLSLACPGPEGSVSARWAELFVSRVKELSNGTVLVTPYGNGILGTEEETVRDCRYGSVDLLIATTASMTSAVPECMLLDYPFLFNDTASVRRVLKEKHIRQYLENAFSAKGMVLLSLTDWGFENLGLTNRFSSKEELEGIPVACSADPCRQAVWSGMGFTPVKTDPADVCLAVRQRAVAGQESTNERFYTAGICETQKYLTDSRHTVSVGGLAAGRETWQHLGQEVRDILLRAAEDCAPLVTEYADEVNETLLGSMMKMGIRVIGLDTVPGLRRELREKAQQAAYGCIAGVTGEEMLNVFLQNAQASE